MSLVTKGYGTNTIITQGYGGVLGYVVAIPEEGPPKLGILTGGAHYFDRKKELDDALQAWLEREDEEIMTIIVIFLELQEVA